jgi:hypothetical protein
VTAHRRRELEGTFAFMLALLVPCITFYASSGYAMTTRVAAAGGLLAVYGTVLIARPIWRAGGPFAWIAHDAVRRALGIKEKETDEEAEQASFDRFYSMLFGPMLVGLGTAANGVSGFFIA